MSVELHDYPVISVIIPAWNVGKYLRRAVESLLLTKYPNLEIVIVDDLSLIHISEPTRPY